MFLAGIAGQTQNSFPRGFARSIDIGFWHQSALIVANVFGIYIVRFGLICG